MRDLIDPWEKMEFSCHECSWKGIGASLEIGEMLSESCEKICPQCGASIFWLEYPLLKDILESGVELSPEDRKAVETMYESHVSWHSQKLKDVDQLPDIGGGHFVLVWDDDSKAGLISVLHGERVIFQQKTSWEYHTFFVAACRILKRKYGYRLMDVVPTPRARDSICGDSVGSVFKIQRMRELIAADVFLPDDARTPSKEGEHWSNYALYQDEL